MSSLGVQRCLHSSKGQHYYYGHPVTQVTFKNCAIFPKCITKIDGTTKDYAENLDLVMLTHIFLE